MQTLTEYGWCPTCEDRRELMMTSAGVFACHACGNVNVFESQDAMMEAQADA